MMPYVRFYRLGEKTVFFADFIIYSMGEQIINLLANLFISK